MINTPSILSISLDEHACIWQVGDMPSGPGGVARLRTMVSVEIISDVADPGASHAVLVSPEVGETALLAETAVASLDALFGKGAWERLRSDDQLVPQPSLELLARFAAADELVRVRDAAVPSWFAQLRWAVLRARLDVHLAEQLGPAKWAIGWLERMANRDTEASTSAAVVEAAREVIASLREERADLHPLCESLTEWVDRLTVRAAPLSVVEDPSLPGDGDHRVHALHYGAVATLRALAGEFEAAAWSWSTCAREWRRAGAVRLAEEALFLARDLRAPQSTTPEQEVDPKRAARRSAQSGLRLVMRRPVQMAAETKPPLSEPADEALMFDVVAEENGPPVAVLRVWRLPGWIQVEHAGGDRLRLIGTDKPLSTTRLPTHGGGLGGPVVRSYEDLQAVVRLYE
jgi:hypothetical protein